MSVTAVADLKVINCQIINNMTKKTELKNNTEPAIAVDTVLAPVFNYRCKKCNSTYTNLKKPLNYSNCVVEKPITHEKCNGQLVSF